MAVNQANVVSINASSTNITTSAYVTLSAAIPINTAKISVLNTTSSVIKLAYGVSGSETDFVAILPSSQLVIEVPLTFFSSGQRLALEALNTTASSGFVAVSLFP